MLVVNESECEKFYPDTDEDYYEMDQGISLSIEGITVEMEDDDTGYIKYINFTIINRGTRNIDPKVEVKVYEEYTSDVIQDYPSKTFDIEREIDSEEWIQMYGKTNIYFDNTEKTVRLTLIDEIENEAILYLTRPLII
jgi:hypothetical protein